LSIFGQPDSRPTVRRNQDTIDDRSLLCITPSAQHVSGSEDEAYFHDGSFLGKQVTLGKITTDEDGRLHVFGGVGNPVNPFRFPLTLYSNNVGCTDDTSDGPVTARSRSVFETSFSRFGRLSRVR
jgi:hypothetical protein